MKSGRPPNPGELSRRASSPSTREARRPSTNRAARAGHRALRRAARLQMAGRRELEVGIKATRGNLSRPLGRPWHLQSSAPQAAVLRQMATLDVYGPHLAAPLASSCPVAVRGAPR